MVCHSPGSQFYQYVKNIKQDAGSGEYLATQQGGESFNAEEEGNGDFVGSGDYDLGEYAPCLWWFALLEAGKVT